MKNLYIQKDSSLIFVPLDFDLDSNVKQGTNLDAYYTGAWVKLSDKQINFYNSNPTATVEEVWNMALTPVPDRTLEQVISEKLAEIVNYDMSEEVNSFLVNNIPAWISAEQRTVYSTSVESAYLLGDETIELELLGSFVTLPIRMAKIMLAKIQRYADKSAIVTAKHKQAVQALTAIEEVDGYDFTVGYPDKETFQI